jgi:hypothetical protein
LLVTRQMFYSHDQYPNIDSRTGPQDAQTEIDSGGKFESKNWMAKSNNGAVRRSPREFGDRRSPAPHPFHARRAKGSGVGAARSNVRSDLMAGHSRE